MTPKQPETYLALSWVLDLCKSLMPKIEPPRKELWPVEKMAANSLLDVFNACKLAAKPLNTFQS